MTIIKFKFKSFKAIRSVITVEPMLFFYFFATIVSVNVGSNLLLHKGCDPNATAAPDLEVKPQCLMEKSAQHGVASIDVWKNVIQELVSLTFIMFAGPWSDNHGRRRRPLMFVPVIGQMLCDVLNIVFTVFWNVSPTITGLVQSLTVSTTGTFHCFFIGIFAFLSDVTDVNNRSMRIGYASAVIPLSATMGSLASGYLNVKLGFVGVFALIIAINAIALILGLLFVYDTSEPYKSSGSLYKTTFNPQIVVKSFKTMIVKRDQHKRLVLLLMIVATPLTGAPFTGEIRLMYLYLRNQFGFKEIEVSLFKAYSMIIMVVGQLFVLGFLSYMLKVNDAMIGMVATLFDILTAVGFLLATQLKYLLFGLRFEKVSKTSKMYTTLPFSIFLSKKYFYVINCRVQVFIIGTMILLYIIELLFTSFTKIRSIQILPPFELFRGAALSLVGSIASKCVEANELGSMNSVRMMAESLSKSAILPLYSIVYNKTLETMPSAYFIISICLTIPLIGCFAVTYFLTRNQEITNQEKKNDPEDKTVNDINANSTISDVPQ